MIRTYKHRIYPNKLQREALDKTFNFCRFLYNCALEERILFYNKYKKSLSWFDQNKYIPQIREQFPEAKTVFAQVIQQTLKTLDQSFKNFFRIVKLNPGKGFPRFKGKNSINSICYSQPKSNLIGGCVYITENNKLHISKLPGEFKVLWNKIKFEGNVKQVRVVKNNYKYYVCLTCDNVPKKELPQTYKSIGIDFGITDFITKDDGTKIKHQTPYRKAKTRIAILNRSLSRKQDGSKNRFKNLSSLRKAYEKVFNVRNDFQHKLSNSLIKEYDILYIEDLNIQSMLQKRTSHGLNTSISDASWGNFAIKLKYKAESAGKIVCEVDPRNTSKMCSGCGNIKHNLKLSDRTYNCLISDCGLIIDRDRNAAINIKRLGTGRVEIVRQRQLKQEQLN